MLDFIKILIHNNDSNMFGIKEQENVHNSNFHILAQINDTKLHASRRKYFKRLRCEYLIKDH